MTAASLSSDPQVAVGNMPNLRYEVSSRHPVVFAEGEDHNGCKANITQGMSRQLAISSVYTGLFIGMSDWRSIFSGDLPGRLSTNNRFQSTAKSPIQLLDISLVSHPLLYAKEHCGMHNMLTVVGACASCEHAMMLAKSTLDKRHLQHVASLRYITTLV